MTKIPEILSASYHFDYVKRKVRQWAGAAKRNQKYSYPSELAFEQGAAWAYERVGDLMQEMQEKNKKV